jgi:hypothetical protein
VEYFLGKLEQKGETCLVNPTIEMIEKQNALKILDNIKAL